MSDTARIEQSLLINRVLEIGSEKSPRREQLEDIRSTPAANSLEADSGRATSARNGFQ